LTGVQDYGGYGVFGQEGAQVAGGFGIGFAVFAFEDQAALASLVLVGRGRFACSVGVRSVAVEMENVIVAGIFADVLAELVEGWRAQDVHVGGQSFRLDQINERAGDGAVADVGLVGTGYD